MISIRTLYLNLAVKKVLPKLCLLVVGLTNMNIGDCQSLHLPLNLAPSGVVHGTISKTLKSENFTEEALPIAISSTSLSKV